MGVRGAPIRPNAARRLTDEGTTRPLRRTKPSPMRFSLSRLLGFSTALLAALLTLSHVGCAPGIGSCTNAGDCPSGQECVEERCIDGSGRTDFIDRVPEPELVHEIDGAIVLEGTVPRVLVGADGGVDVYFLEDPLDDGCGRLMRARPALGTFDLITVAPEGTCFVDFDVARTSDGITQIDHAAVRHEREDGAFGAVTIEIDADGVVLGAMKSFPPDTGGMRGWLPRVSVDGEGIAHAIWTHDHDIDGVRFMDIERVALPATLAPALAAELVSLPAGLAPAYDVDGAPAVFSLDYTDGQNRLLATYGTARTLAQPFSSGSIDATHCGDDLVTAFRFDGDLRVAFLPREGPASQIVVDAGLAPGRTQGDLAMTCADGVVWTAHQSDDHLRVYENDIEVLNVDDDARTVSLAVVEGRAHVAYATTTRALRYASFPAPR